MPLPVEHIKERLSLSYVSAVAAGAGVAFRPSSGPEYGTDGHLVKVTLLKNGRFSDTGHIINCQIKATTTCFYVGSEVVYDLDADAYNKLVGWEGSSPCILIVLSLADVQEDWLKVSEAGLQLQRCCYWIHLTGAPTSNSRTIRISIPRSQIFTPDAVTDILNRLSVQGYL
jgi:hypothetical protein